MISVVNDNGVLKLECSDSAKTKVSVGEKVIMYTERDKTELQTVKTKIEGEIVSFVPAFRRPITEAELTGQKRYVAERAKDSDGYAMYNDHLVEQPNTVEYITIKKANGCNVSVRGFRILSMFKVTTE